MPGGLRLLPADLVALAKSLVASQKGKPSQVSLRRAVSSAYYALFHQLARSGADLLMGTVGADRSRPVWRQTYRALDHGAAATACKNKAAVSEFPDAIKAFAALFVAMQEKRHLADYDPDARFTKSGVNDDIALVELALRDFASTTAKDRRAFCAYILFKRRSS